MRNVNDELLYGIVDLSYVALEDAETVTARMIEGGVDVLQLRAKHFHEDEIVAIGRKLAERTRRAGVPLIINDFPHLVSEIGAEGAHIGQDDGTIADARRSNDGLIGRSTHSVDQAVAAEREGADYIGFGPLFATPTKPDYAPIGIEEIRRVHELVTIPIFCIGGIKLENLERVIAAGARRVVIVSGILLAPDIVAYTRAAKQMLVVARKES